MEEILFKMEQTDKLYAMAAGNIGDAPYMTRILKRAIDSIERTMTSRLRNGEENNEMEMQRSAARMLNNVIQSTSFTLRGKEALHHMKLPPFTNYAKAVIQRTYSGNKDGMHETWADIVERVIETHYYFRKIQMLSLESCPSDNPRSGPSDKVLSDRWNEEAEQDRAMTAAISMFRVQWMPAGRGVQMCRLDLVRALGSMMLNNCGFISTGYSVRAALPDCTNRSYTRLAEFNENKKNHPYGVPHCSAVCPEGRFAVCPEGCSAVCPEGRKAVCLEGRSEVDRDVAVEVFLDAMEGGAIQLMSGVGVGFDAHFNERLVEPDRNRIETYVVPDSREGWAHSYRLLLASYLINGSPTMHFDYSLIRPKGALIRTFGGTASGPGVLRLAHERIRARSECLLRTQRYHLDHDTTHGCTDKASILRMLEELLPYEIAFLEEENPAEIDKKKAFFKRNIEQIQTIDGKTYSTTRYAVDIANDIGVATRMGNLRRSAEIELASPDDAEFFALKDYTYLNPERADIGGTSNNSIQLFDRSQYKPVSEKVAAVVGVRGEPGLVNMVQIWRDPSEDGDNEWELQPDADAEGINPCGETPLCSYELCNLVEVFPCNCATREEWLAACRHAAAYGAVVSCIPTSSAKTNAVVARNHRIGVSQTGLWQFYEQCESAEVYCEALRAAYAAIRTVANDYVVMITGVVPLRVTVVKPSGTLSPLGNAPPGIHPPIQSRYVIRRMRIARNKPLAAQLIERSVPNEVDVYDPTAYVFEFALDQGDMRSAAEVSMWELGPMAILTLRHYGDNAVSISLPVDVNVDVPAQIAAFLKMYLGSTKSLSFMPRDSNKILPLRNGALLSFPFFADHTKALMLLEAIDWVDPEVAEAFRQKPRMPYAQSPYESIDVEEFVRRSAVIGDLDFSGARYTEGDTELIVSCDGMQCSRE